MSFSRSARYFATLLGLAVFVVLPFVSCASSPRGNASSSASSAPSAALLAEDPPAEDLPSGEDVPPGDDPQPEDVKPPAEETPPAGDPSTMAGDRACSWGSNWDCNVCVANVPWQFGSLRDHGEPLGFHPWNVEMNVAYPSSNHIEGIQRLLLFDGRALAISKRDDRTGGHVAVIVSLNSRESLGRRFRSNRLSTSIAQPEDTAPPTTDKIATTLPVLAGFKHGGGMQAVGNVLALPMEEGPGNGRIALYDFNTSISPAPLAIIEGTTAAAGTASLAKLTDHRYVMLLGHGDARKLEVFHSSSWALRSPDNVWTRTEIWEDWKVSPWDSFQNLNFVTDCNDGQLYLIGTSLGVRWGAVGSDYAHLYRVRRTQPLELEHVAAKKFYCSNDGSRQCNFDAGTGVFVDADRQLTMLAVEHADDGPSGTVRLVEFRGVWPNANCGTRLEEAYVDFYDDSGFSDRGFIFDYPDRSKKNWASFHSIDAFNDKASAVRWCIPNGHRVRIYADSNYKGSYKDLIGNGGLRQIRLSDWGFNDKTSSAQWLAF